MKRALLALLGVILLSTPAATEAHWSGDYVYTTDGTNLTIVGYSGIGGVVTIPDTIDHLPVISIGDGAFRWRTSLTSVAIPASVTNIASWAFSGCTGLSVVTIPGSVASIGNDAFDGCTGLTDLTILNGVASVGADAFCGCAGLTSVAIPASVASIGDQAFSRCYSMRGIYFSGNAPILGSAVFDGSSDATVYYLPSTTGWGTTFGGCPTAVWTTLWSGATDLGNGWKSLDWFGDFHPDQPGIGWLWHSEHGWLYAVGTGVSSICFWDNSRQTWWWTSAGVYPYLYRFSDAAWLWYQKDSTSPRRFYNLTAGTWESW